MCGKCGNTDHSKENCEVDPVCINCKGKHEASSKNCPSWKKEKEISRIKTERNLPYPQARKVYESLITPAPEKSFAAAVAQGAPQKFKSVSRLTSHPRMWGRSWLHPKKPHFSDQQAPRSVTNKSYQSYQKDLGGGQVAESKNSNKQTNNQNMGNPFEALSVESDEESTMETQKFVRWARV